jgi:hypothetical protein
MKGYDAASYGDNIADVYDALYGDVDTRPAIDALTALAANPRTGHRHRTVGTSSGATRITGRRY